MDCEKKYPRSDSDMLKFSLKEPLEELKGTDCEFTYEKITHSSGRGRPSLVAVKFTLKDTSLTDIPEKWPKKSPLHDKVIRELTEVWKVDKVSFIKYMKFVGIPDAQKLMSAWAKKGHTNNPIQNRELYCTHAFVEVGKRKMKEEQQSEKV